MLVIAPFLSLDAQCTPCNVTFYTYNYGSQTHENPDHCSLKIYPLTTFLNRTANENNSHSAYLLWDQYTMSFLVKKYKTFYEKKLQFFLFLLAVKSKRIQISRKKRVLEDKTKEMFGLSYVTK